MDRVAPRAPDEEGRYEMTELPAGRYTVTASRGGFLSLRYGQRRPREQGKVVEIADGQVVEAIDLALPKMIAISGRVTDEDGEPMAGVTVLALRSTYIAGRRQLVATSGANLRTDDVIEYRISGLIPGTYVVSAKSGDKWTVAAGGRDDTMGYMPTKRYLEIVPLAERVGFFEASLRNRGTWRIDWLPIGL